METLMLGVIVASVGGAMLVTWALSKRRRLRRALRKAPRVAIGALPEGQVGRVVGTVCRGETVEAPMSGRRCFCYEAVVEEKWNDRWRKVIRETGGLPFAIEDDSGRAVVDPSAAELVLVFDEKSRSGTFAGKASREQEAFLARHGEGSKGFIFSRTLRYHESVIEQGERVAVMGQGVREPDPDAVAGERGYRDAQPTRLRMSGGKKSPLLISDEPDLTR